MADTTQPQKGPAGVFQLNPERAPGLIAKWQKLLGKDIEKINVEYTSMGVEVTVVPMKGSPGFKADDDGDGVDISIAAYKAAKAEASKPSNEEAVIAFKNKFEIRLNKEFPSDGDVGDGGETAVRAFLQKLPFHERRAMLMSNKQFKSAYPNGYTPAPAVVGAPQAA